MTRIETLKANLNDGEGFYISSFANIFYYSGFKSEDARLIITKNECILLTDSRYTVQAKMESPDFEVRDIQKLEIRKSGVSLVSCPTCGRTKIDLISIAGEVEKRLSNVEKDIKVAVMGCAVNGPGEAREADIGIAGGNGEGLIFKKGEIIKRLPENQLIDEFINLIHSENV